MILMSFVLAAQVFGSQYPEYFSPGKEDAFVQDQRFATCGLQKQGLVQLGLYTLEVIHGSDRIQQQEDFEKSSYAGDTRSRVFIDKFAGQDCYVLRAEGSRTTGKEIKGGIMRMVTTTVYGKQRTCWISVETGKILQELDVFQTAKGVYTANAKFNKDDIEIVWTDPSGKYQRTVLNPADGVEPFDREFTPMVNGKEVVLREKKFCRLDPVTKAFKKYTAIVKGRFTGKVISDIETGHTIEITSEYDKKKELVYVTDKGDLVQVDLPGGHYLYLTSAPAKIDKFAVLQQRMGITFGPLG